MATPVDHDGRRFTLGASIGIGVSYEGVSPAELIRDADVAMYAAKRAGKGCIRTAGVDIPPHHAGTEAVRTAQRNRLRPADTV